MHLKVFRQFLTRFSTSDWFFAMLKISTEHGSVVPAGVPVGSCVSTASRALKFFLRAGNNPVVLKNSTERAETLFIALLEDGWIMTEK